MLDQKKEQGSAKLQGRDNQGEKRTFQHSIKVPDLYRVAKKILKKYENKEGALKTLVFKERYRNYKAIYGLLSKVVDNTATIKSAIAVSKLLVEQPKFDPHLAQLFSAQLLAKGSLNGNCKPILIFNDYADRIRAAAEKGFQNVKEKKNACLPRYVRVNTLVGALSRVHLQLQKDGFFHHEYNLEETTYDDFLQLVNDLTYPYYMNDYHIPDLLVFPPGTEFWKSVLYKENVIILQDKGSCLPVYLSSVGEGANVIDACAAPGNKTSLIAAKMNDRGKLIAVERDSERFQTMVKLIRRRQVTCAKTLHSDFLKIDPKKYNDIEYIFLDPSCSSSGTNIHGDEVSTERLGKLATVQGALLSHALSFPSVKEVIYSTCSIYEQENEIVVGDALEKHNDFKLENLKAWQEIWKHFGQPKYNFGQRCLRTDTDIDRCAGFFVAKFVRKGSSKKRKSSESLDTVETEVEADNTVGEFESKYLKEKDTKKSKANKSSNIHDSEDQLQKFHGEKASLEPLAKKSKKSKNVKEENEECDTTSNLIPKKSKKVVSQTLEKHLIKEEYQDEETLPEASSKKSVKNRASESQSTEDVGKEVHKKEQVLSEPSAKSKKKILESQDLEENKVETLSDDTSKGQRKRKHKRN